MDSAIGLKEEAQFAGIVFVGGCLYYKRVGKEEVFRSSPIILPLTKRKEVNMGQTILSIFAIVIGFSACSKPTETISRNEPISKTATLEGTISYFQTEPAMGGETDPSGFFLTNPRWYSGEPAYKYYRVYVSGQINSILLQRRVRVTGTVDTIKFMGVERGEVLFPNIVIQQITILN